MWPNITALLVLLSFLQEFCVLLGLVGVSGLAGLLLVLYWTMFFLGIIHGSLVVTSLSSLLVVGVFLIAHCVRDPPPGLVLGGSLVGSDVEIGSGTGRRTRSTAAAGVAGSALSSLVELCAVLRGYLLVLLYIGLWSIMMSLRWTSFVVSLR